MKWQESHGAPMKSSRQRFAEFREKLRKGLLGSVAFFRSPRRSGEMGGGVDMGGHHAGKWGSAKNGGGGGKHEFKYKKKRLLAEYRVMLKGYYRPVFSLLLLALFTSLLTLTMPMSIKVLLDNVAAGGSLRDIHFLNQFPWLTGFLPGTAYQSLLAVVAMLVGAAIISISLDWLRLLAQQRINYRMAGSLRLRLHAHLSRLPLRSLPITRPAGLCRASWGIRIRWWAASRMPSSIRLTHRFASCCMSFSSSSWTGGWRSPPPFSFRPSF